MTTCNNATEVTYCACGICADRNDRDKALIHADGTRCDVPETHDADDELPTLIVGVFTLTGFRAREEAKPHVFSTVLSDGIEQAERLTTAFRESWTNVSYVIAKYAPIPF